MNYTLLALCALLASLTSCARYYGLTDPNYSRTLEAVKPAHQGASKTGSYGAYEYTSYRRSVMMRAKSGVMRDYRVDVYDFDSDGRFDSVFVFSNGKWKYGATDELHKRYQLIDNGLSSRAVLRHIQTATLIKKMEGAERAKPVVPPFALRKQPEAKPRKIVRQTYPPSVPVYKFINGELRKVQ